METIIVLMFILGVRIVFLKTKIEKFRAFKFIYIAGLVLILIGEIYILFEISRGVVEGYNAGKGNKENTYFGP